MPVHTNKDHGQKDGMYLTHDNKELFLSTNQGKPQDDEAIGGTHIRGGQSLVKGTKRSGALEAEMAKS